MQNDMAAFKLAQNHIAAVMVDMTYVLFFAGIQSFGILSK
jgi:hypothetical protein